MADAIVERRPVGRFFCHRCNVEFEDVLQDYTCPYCASGFIEQLENESEGNLASGDDFSDADMSIDNLDDMSNLDEMSSLDDSDDIPQNLPPVLNDLAFLMSGSRIRNTGRRETFMEQLVWMIGGARPGTGVVTAGAPFVLVGAPGDYVLGGEGEEENDGLDAVVTQLLGQLENAGPPPLPRDQIAAIPSEEIGEDHELINTACSVCWENFSLGETISRLECQHVFHSSCISPWLQLHATCPVCRRSLLPNDSNSETPRRSETASGSGASSSGVTAPSAPVPATTALDSDAAAAAAVAVAEGSTWVPLSESSNSSSSASSASSAAAWTPARASDTSSNSTSSLNSNDRETRHYNMDIDFD